MKRTLLVIGIGAGNPDYLTVQAIAAMNRADVFFLPDKGSEKKALQQLRTDMLDRFVTKRSYRTVEYAMPRRKAVEDSYAAVVEDWHDAIASILADILGKEMNEDETGALLVWGDPSLYDSTLRILERLSARDGFALDYEVIPGITAIQALAARHRIALNTIGQPVLITTGRKLAEGMPPDVDSAVVMLDGEQAFRTVDPGLDIFWGAYLGTPEEILVSGKVGEVGGEIERVRAEARAANGWIMDTYLLRRPA